MRLMTLSDHTEDMASALAADRQRGYEKAVAVYERARTELRASRKTARARFSSAWQERKIFSLLAAGFTVVRLALRKQPTAPVMAAPSQAEERWRAGQGGELEVDEVLASCLDDRWTLVRGYKNRGGEIDRLLLGPLGVFAIEVKNMTGVIDVDGDRWTRDRYDRYGNLKESDEPIGDRRGRSPARQVNDAADALEAFLATRVREFAGVARGVVLSHPRAEIGTVSGLTVGFIANLPALDYGLFQAHSRTELGQDLVARLLDLVRRDHAHYETRRQARASAASA